MKNLRLKLACKGCASSSSRSCRAAGSAYQHYFLNLLQALRDTCHVAYPFSGAAEAKLCNWGWHKEICGHLEQAILAQAARV